MIAGMTRRSSQLNHVSAVAHELAESVPFYCELFGAEENDADGARARSRLPETVRLADIRPQRTSIVPRLPLQGLA